VCAVGCVAFRLGGNGLVTGTDVELDAYQNSVIALIAICSELGCLWRPMTAWGAGMVVACMCSARDLQACAIIVLLVIH
jgi:hypothetical protein